jgi:hypothetical protein
MSKNGRLPNAPLPEGYYPATRVVGSIVEWMNPRTLRWEAISHFGTPEAAFKAASWYSGHELDGWISKKLSKSG